MRDTKNLRRQLYSQSSDAQITLVVLIAIQITKVATQNAFQEPV